MNERCRKYHPVKEFYRRLYSAKTEKGKSILQWAVLWFQMSNDAFFRNYGVNFNPHIYPYLYEIARDEVYGGEK